MKKFIKIILLIVGIILLFLVLDRLYVYKNYYIKQDINIKNDGSIVIKHKDVKNYLDYNGIKIRNDFKNYTFEEDDNSYVQYDKDEEIVNMFAVYNTDTLLNAFKTYDNTLISSIKVEKYLNDNNINSDLELLKFIENYEQYINIFTDSFIIKMDYYIKSYVEDVLPLIYEYKVIEGDYNGILVYNYNYEEEENIDVLLFDDDRITVLSFIGMNVEEKKVVDLVGTVIVYAEE